MLKLILYIFKKSIYDINKKRVEKPADFFSSWKFVWSFTIAEVFDESRAPHRNDLQQLVKQQAFQHSNLDPEVKTKGAGTKRTELINLL